MDPTTTSIVTVPSGPDGRANERGIEGLYATGHWLLSQDRPGDAASVFRALALVAPTDERSWLALGTAHEALEQPEIALEMYGVGHVLGAPAPRCDLSRARLLRSMGRFEDADLALEHAGDAAEARGDDALVELVAAEKRTR